MKESALRDSPESANPYDRTFERLHRQGMSADDAVQRAVEDYLDGKPRLSGKKKVTRTERDAAFWESTLVNTLPTTRWNEPPYTLALTRYFEQDRVAADALMRRLVLEVPDVVCVAARQSGIVMRADSTRRDDLRRLALEAPEVAELCAVLDIFDQAHRVRCNALDAARGKLVELTPFELLIYASLYAFAELVPQRFGSPGLEPAIDEQEAWGAINDLLLWKLKFANEADTRLEERGMGQSMARHLSPFLFPSRSRHPSRDDLFLAFIEAFVCQIEFNAFVARSIDAFSYDNSIRFVRNGRALEIEVLAPEREEAWRRDSDKLERLKGYWFNRAFDEFVESDLVLMTFGRRENHEGNRMAHIKAMQSWLRLTEVYGVGETVHGEAGEPVDLFVAIRSLELMNVFFEHDFLAPYTSDFGRTGDWLGALSRLALNGLSNGMQNRFPVTSSDRAEKIKRITGWTVNPANPKGSPRMAAAVLDFWTSDWAALAKRLRDGGAGLEPELFERPVIKMGQQLLQLPWIVGVQDVSSAAINNLRRLGARHANRRTETQQIELRLGALFESRGFRVLANWNPPKIDFFDPGEIDLVCARDGVALVIEVKSSYLRHSKRDAWMHQTTTLRRAGQQLRDKVNWVERAVAQSTELRSQLGLPDQSAPIPIHGWIVDTSIECDHMRFGGFLKVSLEEVLIALRDDAHLLCILQERFGGAAKDALNDSSVGDAGTTLYSDGFSATAFISVIESASVWGRSAAP